MRRNENFQVPQRQSQWAIIFIVLRFIRKLALQLWPILLALFLGRSGNNSFDRFELIISGLGVFGMIASIVAYFRYYYFISDTELVIKRGVFSRINLNIPFERIQSINLKQSPLHRLLGVTELELDTAGSKEKELQIDALVLEKAHRLRNILLEKKAKLIQDSEEEEVSEPQAGDILQLSTKDLLKVGLTQNHFKPIGLLIGFVFSAIFYSYTIDIEPTEVFKYIFQKGSEMGFAEYLVVAMLIAPLSIIFSLMTVYFRHYNLRFWRISRKFHVIQGLLTRREIAAVDKKIQILSWGQNLLERKVGFFNIQFRQARSGDARAETSHFVIPGCNKIKVQFVQKCWLEKFDESLLATKGVSVHYFLHRAFYIAVGFILFIALLIYFKLWGLTIPLFLLSAGSAYFRWISFKKKSYGIVNDIFYLSGGTLGFRNSILPIYKIQNVNIHQNPYQWRRGLASLVIHTAAGPLTLPYINYNEAVCLLDKLIFSVEKSAKAWM